MNDWDEVLSDDMPSGQTEGSRGRYDPSKDNWVSISDLVDASMADLRRRFPRGSHDLPLSDSTHNRLPE